MTHDVITARPSMGIDEAVRRMEEHAIGGMPVTDEAGLLVGMISDGDLARRANAAGAPEPLWHVAPASSFDGAIDFVRPLTRVVSVMTSPVIAVDEETPVAEIARLFEEFGIKRVPVTMDGSLVGIVSRADLVRALVVVGTADLDEDDHAMRSALLLKLREDAGISDPRFSVMVENGTVHLWGILRTETERRVVQDLVRAAEGVRRVDDHTTTVEPHFVANGKIPVQR